MLTTDQRLELRKDMLEVLKQGEELGAYREKGRSYEAGEAFVVGEQMIDTIILSLDKYFPDAKMTYPTGEQILPKDNQKSIFVPQEYIDKLELLVKDVKENNLAMNKLPETTEEIYIRGLKAQGTLSTLIGYLQGLIEFSKL